MKRLVLTTLQIAVTLLLLFWIFHDPAKRAQMFAALQKANLLWFLPGIVAIGLACLLQTIRWRTLLLAQGIPMGFWRAYRVYLIGAFFSLFLPGGTGGDAVKIFYAMRETTSKSAAFLSVLIDRMMGLLGLVAVAVVFCSLRLDLLLSRPFTRAMMGSLTLILGVSVGLVVFGFIVDRFHLARKLPAWLPLRHRVLELASAFSTYARDPRVLLITFGLSLPAHLLIFLSYYFSARAFGAFNFPGGIGDIFSLLPAINTITALPISVSGIGLREQLFQHSFSALFQTQESTAAMISIGGFLMTVFWAIVGGVVYILYRPSGGLNLSVVEEEVAVAEQSAEEGAY